MRSYSLQTILISPSKARWVDQSTIEAVTDGGAIARAVAAAAELFREQAGEALLTDWSGRAVWSHSGEATTLLPSGSARPNRSLP